MTTTASATAANTTAPEPSSGPPTGETGTTMLSPNAMAQAVLDSAMTERDRLAANNTTETLLGTTQDSSNNVRSENHDGMDAKEKLKQVWEGGNKENAVHDTMRLVHGEVESLVRAGLEAYHGWESANRDLVHAKEECEAKDRELRRLRASEEQSRATITVCSSCQGMPVLVAT